MAEERAGRNVLVRAAETFSAEPWRAEWSEWWRTAEPVTDALTHAKSEALDLDANLTPCTEWTMCGFVGLTFLFRGTRKASVVP